MNPTIPASPYPLQLQMQPTDGTIATPNVLPSIPQPQQLSAEAQANLPWQLTTGTSENQLYRIMHSGKILKNRHPISHAKRVRDWIARGGLTRGPPSSGSNDGSHSKRRKGKGKGGKKMRALLERGDPSQYLAIEGEECSM